MRSLLTVLAAAITTCRSVTNVFITVGGNDGLTVFDPAEATAEVGDTVIFNFTQGNHSVIQSNFTSPCVALHDGNMSFYGFNSGPHDTMNGTANAMYGVLVKDNATIWYFDPNTCGDGGVGGININTSTEQTLDGARQNAIRFNGTTHTYTRGPHASNSHSMPTATTGRPSHSDAKRTIVLGFGAVIPMAIAALLL